MMYPSHCHPRDFEDIGIGSPFNTGNIVMNILQSISFPSLISSLILSATTCLAPAHAASFFTLAQFPIPISNPLDQLLKGVLDDVQDFLSIAQDDLDVAIGNHQPQIRGAIDEAIGPLILDAREAEKNMLSAIEEGPLSEDGIHATVKQQGTAQNALTKVVEAQYLSKDAQQNSEELVLKTQAAIDQIKQCAETANSAPSTQDALKALTCQYIHLGTLQGIVISQNDGANRMSAALVRAMNELNQYQVGQNLRELRRQQAETAAMREVYLLSGFDRYSHSTQVK
ncbi:MAG: hypothetical protein SFW36_03075 [Leptolyngbyaceae cyanobacterium bins.59]|nr:hypothetical protein [Leptolyngbyaceae cyanobacterium bins.59]